MALFKFEHLLKAQNLYDVVAQILIKNPDVDQTNLADAENKVLFISHLFATRYNGYMSSFDVPSVSSFGSTSDGSFVRRNDLSYRTGTDILRSRVERLEKEQNPDLRRLARARMELADWLLVANRRMSAVDFLEETHQRLINTSLSPAEVDQLFNPALPLEIPTFLTPGYSRADLGIPEDALLKFIGFVDLDLREPFGNPSSIRVLGTSPDTNEEIPAHW